MKNSLAIIITTYNGSKWIQKCLESVFSNEFNGHFQVTVVDNSSTDPTVEIIEKGFPIVDLIKLHENKGFVGGNNVGIKEALRHKYEYVLLLNQDTELDKSFLTEIVKVADNNQIAIVQGMLELGNRPTLTNNIGNALHYLGFGFVKHYKQPVILWKQKNPFSIGYASGACMLIKTDVLKEVGLLDEKFFMYHEDLDFCWRARMSDYKIMIAPRAVCKHFYEFNRNNKMFYWTERNRWAVLLQNYQIGTLIALSPMLFAIELMMIIYSTAQGWLNHKLLSYVWIIKSLPEIFVTRSRVQKLRKVRDREVMKHMQGELLMPKVDNFVLKYIVSPLVKLYFKIIRVLI